MKKTHESLIHQTAILILLIAIPSCFAIYRQAKVTVEYDAVKFTQRVKTAIYYRGALERNSPLYGLSQTILKESAPHGVSYTVYDILSMSANVYPLEEQLYVIIGAEAIPIEIQSYEVENSTQIAEETASIMTVDSAKVSVVTGYTQYEVKKAKISYQISPAIIDKISRADVVKFRYYAGPSMITTQLAGANLRAVKQVIAEP